MRRCRQKKDWVQHGRFVSFKTCIPKDGWNHRRPILWHVGLREVHQQDGSRYRILETGGRVADHLWAVHWRLHRMLLCNDTRKFQKKKLIVSLLFRFFELFDETKLLPYKLMDIRPKKAFSFFWGVFSPGRRTLEMIRKFEPWRISILTNWSIPVRIVRYELPIEYLQFLRYNEFGFQMFIFKKMMRWKSWFFDDFWVVFSFELHFLSCFRWLICVNVTRPPSQSLHMTRITSTSSGWPVSCGPSLEVPFMQMEWWNWEKMSQKIHFEKIVFQGHEQFGAVEVYAQEQSSTKTYENIYGLTMASLSWFKGRTKEIQNLKFSIYPLAFCQRKFTQFLCIIIHHQNFWKPPQTLWLIHHFHPVPSPGRVLDVVQVVTGKHSGH